LIYDPLALTALTATGSVTINCAKTGGNSDTVYYELGSDGGINISGAQSRVLSGANAINYGSWQDIGHSLSWKNLTSNRIKGSVSGTASSSVTINYYIQFGARQNAAVGSFTDTQTIKLYQGILASAASTTTSFTSTTASLTVSVAAQCTLSSPPGNLMFNYTSFQTTPSLVNTAFAVTCISGVPYTMALDASSGTLLGLAYSLSLSKTGTQTGSGAAQSAAINGTMAAGQAGTCSLASCSATEARTLTISY
jgi:spore coat protein U-like protein